MTIDAVNTFDVYQACAEILRLRSEVERLGSELATALRGWKQDVAALRARLQGQVDHSITLQRLIEALARGEVPDVTDDAPHLSQVARKAGELVAALRAERDEAIERSTSLDAALAITQSHRERCEQARDAARSSLAAALVRVEAAERVAARLGCEPDAATMLHHIERVVRDGQRKDRTIGELMDRLAAECGGIVDLDGPKRSQATPDEAKEGT